MTERDGDSGSALPDHRCNTSDADSSSAHTAANRASGAREKGAALLRANSDVDGRAAAYRDGTRAQRMVTLANRARDAVVRRGLPGIVPGYKCAPLTPPACVKLSKLLCPFVGNVGCRLI